MRAPPPSVVLGKKGKQQSQRIPGKLQKNSHQFTLVRIHFQMQACISAFRQAATYKEGV